MAARGSGEPVDRCGTMPVHVRLLQTNADYAAARLLSEERALIREDGAVAVERLEVTRIPVVVHVVYKTAPQNISDQQIQSQVAILNQDFRMRNPDRDQVPQPYAPLAADARIEFFLATVDPRGAPTTGITRTRTSRDSFGTDDQVKRDAQGGRSPWPTDRYLNLWVCQLSGGMLGYGTFPGAPADIDGVVVRHSAFGTGGTATGPYNLGRTTTHEVGHWLNLHHVWGDQIGCGNDDLVNDTPAQSGPNYGRPQFPHITCDNGPAGDMFMNYMDYVDDAAMMMFTRGQVVRMATCLDADRVGIGQ